MVDSFHFERRKESSFLRLVNRFSREMEALSSISAFRASFCSAYVSALAIALALTIDFGSFRARIGPKKFIL